MKKSFSVPQKTFWLGLALFAGLLLAARPGQSGADSNTGPPSAKPAFTAKVMLPHTRFATRYYLIDSGVPGPAVMIVGGVHGNEPAGAFAADDIRHWPLKAGRLLVLPCANVPGLAANKRLIPGLDTNLSNLNRNYPRAGETGGARGEPARSIWQLALDYKPDWVLDLHEGYDFHQLNGKSVGSSIICFPLPEGQAMADAMLDSVNSTITSNLLKFVRRDLPVDGSLARAAGEHLRVPGMTIETTKSQPMEKRVGQQLLIVHRLLEKLGMVQGQFQFANHTGTNIAALIAMPKIAAALYKGPGTGGNGPPDLLRRLNTGGETSLTEVSPEDIRAGALTNYDAVIFAGGSGSKEAEALGEPGRAQVEQFVGNGGGYIGICAGAYLATSGYSWSLHIINARTLSPKWQRGHATLPVELTPDGAELFGGAQTNLEIIYHNGPVVGPAADPNLPAYEPLAFFRAEVASNNTPKMIMVNSPAIFAGRFRQGKVICISPHPEQTPGLEYIVPRALAWVAPSATKEASEQFTPTK